jgi:tetratricopeptide (TPR) repeat protein
VLNGSLLSVQLIALVVSFLATNGACAQQAKADLKMWAMLPPYCRYTHLGVVEGMPGAKNPQQIERWKLVMGAQNFRHIHHYCQGLQSTNRALFGRLAKQHRDFELRNSIIEFDYVILRVTPDFVLLPEILTKKGENLMRLGRAPEAMPALFRAIERKADYWPPYAVLSDYYKEIGKIEEAREWLQKGLAASPEATALQKRLRELSHSAAR